LRYVAVMSPQNKPSSVYSTPVNHVITQGTQKERPAFYSKELTSKRRDDALPMDSSRLSNDRQRCALNGVGGYGQDVTGAAAR
jgi:hypothetical protein